MSAPMSKKQFNALARGQRAALTPVVIVNKDKKRRARRARNPPQGIFAAGPKRNGQGRRRGGRRNRGGLIGGGTTGIPLQRRRGENRLAGRGSTQNYGSNRRGQVIIEDEFVAAVTVANQPNFNAVKFPVNIGQAGTFPWGATVAKNYQKYQFDSLEFYYKREVSEFATNGQVGKVMLFFNPDAADPDPTTKQQVEDSECHSDAMPSENFRLVVPPTFLKRLNDSYFIRPGAQPANTDIKTYDVGNLYICTQGIVNNVEIGELHVRYRCRVMIPVIPGIAGAGPTSQFSAFFQDAASQALGGGTDTTLLLATATNNGLGVVNTAGSMVPPAGNYAIDWLVDVIDTVGETVNYTFIVKKNGTTVYVTNPSTRNTTLGANQSEVVSGSVFVAANGTDAFTLVVNAGTATASAESATFRWLSV